MRGTATKRGVLLIGALAVGVGVTALAGAGDVIDAICAIALVFVLPGAALAIFLPLGANRAERVALMLALGVASLILASIGLAAIGIKLDSTSWILAQVGVSVFGCIVAFVVSKPRQRRTTNSRRRRRSASMVRPGSLALGLVALTLVAAAGVISVESKHAQDRESQFTQLWTLPEMTPGAATIGVSNREGGVRSYMLRADSEGNEIARWGPVRIGPGRTWERRLQAPAGTRRVHVILEGTGEGKRIHHTTSLTVG